MLAPRRASMSVLQSRHVRAAAGSFLLACFAACQASGWYEHRFQPAPLESEVLEA